MAIHYVDYEGEAGSGDGSSFANRSKRLSGISASAGDEIRIKQTPNPTVLSTAGKVIKDHGAGGYNSQSTSSSNIYYSTTAGQTYFHNLPAGWQTGDIMVICHHEAPAGQNLNGAWRLTVTESPRRGYFDGFTASSTDSVSTHTLRYITGTANTVQIGSSPVKVLASTDAARTAWTASSNVTTSIGYDSSYTDWNQYGKWQVPTGSDEIALTTTASTGKAAYFALGSSTDLSAYQQISFLFSVSSGNTNLTSNGGAEISLRLCTDTQGDTSVHTIPINNGFSTTNKWLTILKDFESNLNSGIQSIAIYIETTLPSNVTIRLNNIIASKASSSADSLTLSSMIGLNTTADKIWYPVGYILDRGSYCLIVLATWPQARGSAGFGYYGNYCAAWWSQTFNSTTIYKREQVFPVFIQEGNFSSSSSTDQWNGAGSSGSLIVISGGWNSSDMTSIVGATFTRGSGMGRCFTMSGRNYIEVKNLFFCGFYSGPMTNSNNSSIDNVGWCNMDTYNTLNTGNWQKLNIIYCYGMYGWGMSLNAQRDTINTDSSDFNIHYINSGQVNQRSIYCSSHKRINWNYVNCEGSANDGFFIDSHCEDVIFDTFKSGWSRGGYTVRFYDSSNFSKNIRIKNLSMYSGGGMEVYSNGVGFSIDNIIATTPTYTWRFGEYYSEASSYCVRSKNSSTLTIKGGSVQNRFYPQNGATIKTIGVALDDSEYNALKTSPANISSSHDAKLLCKDYDDTSGDTRNFFGKGRVFPESTIRKTASGVAWKFNYNPNDLASRLNLEIGKVIVNSGSLVSISVWAYKSTSSAVGVLTIPANSDIGLSSDATADTSSASATTWTKITSTFTPTAAGIVTVLIGAYNTGSNEAVYFDDVEITQA